MPKTNRRPTLYDVAKRAGVSLGTASNALSNPDKVRKSTYERLMQAVAELGYLRDGAARALASRRTHTIGAIYPTLNNPIFAHSTHSMQQTLWERGYQLLIASHEYQIKNELKLLQSVIERGIDGLIMVGTDHRPEIFALLEARNLPYVLTWSTDDTEHPHCVGISNFAAAYDLGRFLLKKGHERVAICGGDPSINERARGRRDGVIHAFAEQGIPVPAERLLFAEFSYQGGRAGLRQALALEDRPTVVTFGTDLQAVGALDEARRLNVKVPEEISIVGFDGIDEGRHIQPSLATVLLPAHEVGQKAAERIVELIEGKTLPPTQPLKHEIIDGNSLLDLSGLA